MCICSSTDYRLMEPALERLDIAKYFDFTDEEWQTAIENSVPAKFLELNKKAFELGKNS